MPENARRSGDRAGVPEASLGEAYDHRGRSDGTIRAHRAPGNRFRPVRVSLPRSVRVPLVFMAVVFLSLLFSSCMDGGSHHGSMHQGRDSRGGAVVEASSEDVDVRIEDYSFQPGNLRVAAGTTVTWTNGDGVAHTATARDGTWDTGILRSGESATFVLTEPGVYDYYCIPHPTMQARIEVVG